MQFRPSSALRNEYTQISELAKASGEPIFITNKGEDDGVYMSMAAYEEREKMFRHRDTWRQCDSKMPYEPETMAAQKLMHIFLQQKKSLGVVIDEFGGTSGIVSLEDIVEEIFGDIEDEHDSTKYIATQVGDNEYMLSARLEIDKVNDLFDLDLP